MTNRFKTIQPPHLAVTSWLFPSLGQIWSPAPGAQVAVSWTCLGGKWRWTPSLRAPATPDVLGLGSAEPLIQERDSTCNSKQPWAAPDMEKKLLSRAQAGETHSSNQIASLSPWQPGTMPHTHLGPLVVSLTWLFRWRLSRIICWAFRFVWVR